MTDHDLRQISFCLYTYLCRHVVGTEDTVRTKRVWNTLNDNSNSYHTSSCITSGSFGEGLEMKGSDVDIMIVIQKVVVFEEITDIQSDLFKAAYFQITTDDTKPGFVKLFHIGGTDKLYIDLCEMVGSDLYLSNVYFKNYFSILLGLSGSMVNDKFHGPCISDNEGLYDQAFCLHCKSWSSQANVWRWRSNNAWPSSYLKARVVEHGVLLVPIGVKDSPNEDIQWRISFSVGEKLLIYSFTHTQLLCYALMKIVLKDLINIDPECEDLLCSYFIKNIIFWISEELPLSIWRPDNLVPCFMQCLDRLIYCVEYSMCVHYFIPENNMFENRIEGEKRNILLDKLHTLYSFNWRCILLSPQLHAFHVDSLKVETLLFDVYFEQIVSSKVMFNRPYNMITDPVYYLFRTFKTYRSSLIKHVVMGVFSRSCYHKAQCIQLCSTYSNKTLYRQYKTCQSYLMLGLHHDAVSGWLMVSSMFYGMKQYKRALEIVFYSLEKCSLEKTSASYKTELSMMQRELLKSETMTSMGIQKAINILHLKLTAFEITSTLIPKEFEIEVADGYFFLPPIVHCHCLRFLCHYHLHDIRQCRDSIRDIIRTISQQYFNYNNNQKALAYNCLGVAFQLIGDTESARQAFLNAIQLDTRFNSALHRLSMLEEVK